MASPRTFFGLAVTALLAVSAPAQLRVCSWNITNYSSGRTSEFQTSIYGVFSGRSLAPDVILAQEILSDAASLNFLTILNTAPGSPGDWARVPFVNGPDTDQTAFYRTSRVTHLSTVIAATGSTDPNDQPRHTMRHDFRLAGYSANSTVIAMYNSHMKASSGTSDQARRLVEANKILTNVATLPAGYHFLFGGDTNMQNSSQAAYQALVSGTWGTRQFNDPIKTPGSWENNGSFRFVHTQDPGPGKTMDSRFDFLLLSSGLMDGTGLDYIGNPNVAYSTTTWNDPNHSYRCWGNDGSSFNAALNISTNSMVGSTIATALQNSAVGGGHLPVFLDMKVPAKIGLSASLIDLGNVQYLGRPQATVTLTHAGDIAKWTTAGLQNLVVTPTADPKITIVPGTRTITPGMNKLFTMRPQTNVLGRFQRNVTLATNDPDFPTRTITLKWNVVRGYPWQPVRNPIEGPRGGF
ncbi:MAG: hypothetical protein JNJ45_00100 [Chthonomonas sp.]|nr:hypothetical protein [Chthonomonas sp.]